MNLIESQFTKCTALDLAPKKIRCNSINPAAIETPIFQTQGLSEELVGRVLADCKLRYPAKRVGNVSDTSTAIAFLADEKVASFLTGILLTVDGKHNNFFIHAFKWHLSEMFFYKIPGGFMLV